MTRFRKSLAAIVLILVASASPEYFYGFAAGVMNFDRSRGLFYIRAYISHARYLFQHLSFQLVAVAFLGVYGLKRLWTLLFSPLDYKCELADTGYLGEGASKRDTANQVRKRRKIGEIPPIYPNGWFFVICSADLPMRGLKYVQILGEHLAVFRGEDGVAYILDAYCPHLGANIAVGGQVKGSCVQCPFHGWRFKGEDGACVEVPYSKCVPDFAKTKAWHTIEKNDRVYIWYHAEGIGPNWFPEDIEMVQNGAWHYSGRTVHHINCHIEVSSDTNIHIIN